MSSFTLAVDRPARQDGTTEKDFIPVVAWGKAAEYAAEQVKPNNMLIVEGRIHTRPVEQNGQRQWTTEVYANALKAVAGMTQSAPVAAMSAPVETVGQNPFTEDDVPF